MVKGYREHFKPWIELTKHSPAVRKAIEVEPPRLLYHYTNQAGLLGIVAGGAIWASQIQYLNDQAEFHHAFRLFKTEVARLIDAPDTSSDDRALLVVFLRKITGLLDLPICVSSFSTERDSLPQWRAYGEPGSAFAIGFDSLELSNAAIEAGFLMVPCVYDEPTQIEVMREIAPRCLTIARQNKERKDKLWVTNALKRLPALIAPALKHRAFSEEREWRLVSPVKTSKELRFRPGKSSLVPYCEVEVRAVTIGEIVVGPSSRSDVSIRAVEHLLRQQRREPVNVVKTDAPYRAW